MIHSNKPEQIQNAINAAMYLVNPEKITNIFELELQGCVALVKAVRA
jgi:hypothetical protein